MGIVVGFRPIDLTLRLLKNPYIEEGIEYVGEGGRFVPEEIPLDGAATIVLNQFLLLLLDTQL